MPFNSQNISTTATFTTGGVSETSSIPNFTQWENTTSQGFEWNLGNKWTMNVNQAEDQLSFSYNGQISFRANSSGIMDIDLSVDASGDQLSLTNQSTLPSVSSYTDGTMIRYNNEMYILEED